MTQATMIETWIEAVCGSAGWTPPSRNMKGVYRFRLADNVNVDVSAPSHRELFMTAKIAALSGPGRDRVLETVASAVLPRVFTDSGVVALDPEDNTLVLEKRVILGALRHSQFPQVLETFLNDLYFYQSLIPKP